MKKIITPLATVFILLMACKKDTTSGNKRTCNSTNEGSFSALIDNKSWVACEFKAVYYTKAKTLSVTAIDENSNIELRFFISVDTISPLKTYNINAVENNGLEIVESIVTGNTNGWDIYFCDLLKPGIGGSFSITKLDTITGKISATFNINGYSQNRIKTIMLSNGILNDVKLATSSAFYDESYLKATINGVNWYSNQVFAQVTEYIGSPLVSFLEIRAMGYPGDLGDCPQYISSYTRDFFLANARNLKFNVPLSLNPGTYPLESSKLYHQTISSQHYLFSYNHHDLDNSYYPILGSSISITNLDVTNRNLDADFTAQAKDSLGNSFNFTLGKIHIKNWLPY